MSEQFLDPIALSFWVLGLLSNWVFSLSLHRFTAFFLRDSERGFWIFDLLDVGYSQTQIGRAHV